MNLQATECNTTDGFDLWAAVYDCHANPLLALETRWLPDLLPAVTGCSVLDVGCGTGRWLTYFESLSPASLTGCDPSAAMLANAKAKLSPATILHRCSADALPLKDFSLDLILASFVLSYVKDIASFAAQCSRSLKPGGQIVVTDMHPSTALRQGWKRGFRVGGERINIPTHHRSLSQIASAFHAEGFILTQMKVPPFDEPERSFFEEAGKLKDYLALMSVPAIYIMSFQKPALQTQEPFGKKPVTVSLPSLDSIFSQTPSAAAPSQRTFRLQGAPMSIDGTHWNHHPLAIQDGFFRTADAQTDLATLNLTGYVLLPGLINAHDHLEFSLFPNLGRSRGQPPYRNATEWANEIQQAHEAVIQQQRRVPLATRLWFGAIRNLLCGATTVCHHNPLYAELCAPDFPVRVVQDFSWAHSLSFDQNIPERLATSSPGKPFIIHAGEGTDRVSRQEVRQLQELNLLTQKTVLVHGLALTRADMALLNKYKTSVILCPTSNRLLFGKTLDALTIASLDRVALGSDSSLTAAGDLLDELHCLASQVGVPSTALYKMVTAQPASMLHLDQGEGTIVSGAPADLIAVRRRREQSPCEVISTLTLEQIELVLLAGRVHLASPTLYHQLPPCSRQGMHCVEILTPHQAVRRWIRAPLPALFASAEQVLGVRNVRLGNKEVRHLPTP